MPLFTTLQLPSLIFRFYIYISFFLPSSLNFKLLTLIFHTLSTLSAPRFISLSSYPLPQNFLRTSSILPTKYLNITTFPNSPYPHTYTPYFMPFPNYSITPNPTNLTFFFRRHSTLVNRTRLRNFLTSTQT